MLIFLAVSVVIVALRYLKPELVDYPSVWVSQAFMFVVILVSHWFSSKGLRNKASDFHIYYMASMGFRFILALFYLLIMVYISGSEAWVMVINFFLLYFLYTSFEIYSLISNLRAEN